MSKKLVGSPQVRNPSSTAICKVRKKKGGKSKENPATLQLQHFVKKKKPKKKETQVPNEAPSPVVFLQKKPKQQKPAKYSNPRKRERRRGGEAGHESKCMS